MPATKKKASAKKETGTRKSTTTRKRSTAKKTEPTQQEAVQSREEVFDEIDHTVPRQDPWAHINQEPPLEPKKRVSPTKYLRNRREMELNIRFVSQPLGTPRTHFAPRGVRGDLTLLRQEWIDDPILFANLEADTVEVITEDEAREIMKKQYTNARQQQHPALAQIQTYEDTGGADSKPVTRVEFDDPHSRDITVTQLQPTGAEGAGNITWDQRGEIVRTPQPTQVQDPYTGQQHIRKSGEAPTQVAAPGSALNPTVTGPPPHHEVTEASDPETIQQEIARLRDLAARQPSSGPGAGVAGLNVEVEPVKRQ